MATDAKIKHHDGIGLGKKYLLLWRIITFSYGLILFIDSEISILSYGLNSTSMFVGGGVSLLKMEID